MKITLTSPGVILLKNVAVMVAAGSAASLVRQAVINNVPEPETRRGQLKEKLGLLAIGSVVTGAVATSLNSDFKDVQEALRDAQAAWHKGVENAKSEDNSVDELESDGDIRKI